MFQPFRSPIVNPVRLVSAPRYFFFSAMTLRKESERARASYFSYSFLLGNGSRDLTGSPDGLCFFSASRFLRVSSSFFAGLSSRHWLPRPLRDKFYFRLNLRPSGIYGFISRLHSAETTNGKQGRGGGKGWSKEQGRMEAWHRVEILLRIRGDS